MHPNTKKLLWLIFIGFILRLISVFSTPALFEWDEAFHALVAKNMMDNPFKPMLRVNPLLSFDYKAWCCNHLWLHKQPFFLWQMALSMKIFGTSVWAMRLPSALMGVMMIPLVYKIGLNWTNSSRIGFLAAALCCFHYYQLGLISGRLMLDHNDMAFAFYMTCSIWALSNFIKHQNFKNAILIGSFVGLAILIKWLTALLIFGGLGLYLLLRGRSFFLANIKYFLTAIIISVLIALPWQLYILETFPKEAAFTYEYNVKHIFETLGHDGGYAFHINKIFMLYGITGVVFIPIGLFYMIRHNKTNRLTTYSFLAMILVIYLFFSIIVTTKMPAFTLPVSSLVFIIIATGLSHTLEKVPTFNFPVLLLSFVFFLKPWIFINKYLYPSQNELNKIHNTNIYKNLPDSLASYTIFNLKPYQDIDLMFHKNNFNAFTWYPTKKVVDTLMNEGVKIAIFKSHTNQAVPAYMVRDDILMIDKQLK